MTFYGLTNWSQARRDAFEATKPLGRCQASAQVAAAWLLATHDGSVLLLADDVPGTRTEATTNAAS